LHLLCDSFKAFENHVLTVLVFFLAFMNALSRREEETLLKTTKARALRECDAFVKGPDLAFFSMYILR
jgi:hypothetical protein